MIPGQYTATELCAELQRALNALSGITNTYTATYSAITKKITVTATGGTIWVSSATGGGTIWVPSATGGAAICATSTICLPAAALSVPDAAASS